MTERSYNPDFPNDYRNEVGSLGVDAPRLSKGKKVFEWQFNATGAQCQIPVEVYLVKSDGQMQFKAICKRLEHPIVDTDINRLHTQVESALLEQASALSGIAWEDWFEVVVKGNNSDFTDSVHSALGANLHIQVNRLKRGIHPVTGRPVTINCNGIVVDFPQATSLQDKDTEPDAWLRQHAKEQSYIPATAENRKALDDILSRMAMLRTSLAGVLSQEVVQARLASVEILLLQLTDKGTGTGQ